MTYTDEELKAWFEMMKKLYPNSATYNQLVSVEHIMFNSVFEKNRLENFKKALDTKNKE